MSLSGTFGMASRAGDAVDQEAGQTAASILQFRFLVLCPVFFPFSALPASLRGVSQAIRWPMR
jgi:hypothetical protein